MHNALFQLFNILMILLLVISLLGKYRHLWENLWFLFGIDLNDYKKKNRDPLGVNADCSIYVTAAAWPVWFSSLATHSTEKSFHKKQTGTMPWRKEFPWARAEGKRVKEAGQKELGGM